MQWDRASNGSANCCRSRVASSPRSTWSSAPIINRISRDDVARYRDAGVDQLVVMAFAPGAEAVPRALDTLVSDYLEPAKRL